MTDYKQYVAASQPVSDNDMDSVAPVRGTHYSVSNNNLVNNKTDSAIQETDYVWQPTPRAEEKNIQNVANTVSGTQIVENIDVSDVTDLLSRINSENADVIAKQELSHSETQAEVELQQEKLIAARKAALLKERVAKEEAHRKAQEELERKLEEEERLREDKKLFGRKSGDTTSSSQMNAAPPPVTDIAANSNQPATDWEYIAKHDPLTGLLNSSAYNVDIETAPLSSCILFIDANNLKYLNDTFGHEAGDKLLSVISKTLLRYFDGSAYRIAGDEFVVITTRPEDKVKKIIKNMKATLERQTKADKSGMIYSVAVGYAYGDGKTPLSEVRKKAAELMYADKKAYTDTITGLKNQYAFECAPFASVLTLIQIVGFDDLSRANGDKFAELTGKCLKNDAKKTEECFYIDNGEFCILSEHTPDVLIATIKAKLHSISIDIVTQIVTGTESNEKNLFLARESIAIPKEKPKSYNERLSLTQRQMKETVCANHEPAIEDDINNMIDIIQQKSSEIIMVFMTSPDFNNLFIFLNATEFLQVAWDMGASMDYSYIYAVYPGGAIYYGANDYYSEITDLFQQIAENMSGRDVRLKEISHIEGINIFENIYVK